MTVWSLIHNHIPRKKEEKITVMLVLYLRPTLDCGKCLQSLVFLNWRCDVATIHILDRTTPNPNPEGPHSPHPRPSPPPPIEGGVPPMAQEADDGVCGAGRSPRLRRSRPSATRWCASGASRPTSSPNASCSPPHFHYKANQFL